MIARVQSTVKTTAYVFKLRENFSSEGETEENEEEPLANWKKPKVSLLYKDNHATLDTRFCTTNCIIP